MSRATGFLFILLISSSADAQVGKMSSEVQEFLTAIGPVWGEDIRGNIQRTLEIYTPILREAPKAGVRVTRDVA